MRVLLLLLLLSTSTVFAQFPNLVEVDEYTAENPKRMVELLNTWSDFENEVTGGTTFVLEVMNGNKVYYCRSFENMEALVTSRRNRWGKEGSQAKIMKQWQATINKDKSEEEASENGWYSTAPKKVQSHLFWYVKNMSYIPEGTDLAAALPNLLFRRHIMIDVNEGPGVREKFKKQISLGIENDKKLKNDYIRVMYMPFYGGVANADYMMIVLGKSRADYYTSLQERSDKRKVDQEWNSIQDSNVASWILEEDIMVHY